MHQKLSKRAKRILALVAGLAVASTPCAAESETGQESFDWSGLYLGLQTGAAAARVTRNGAPDRFEGSFYGGYAGYLHQFGASPLVVGIETDFAISDMARTRMTQSPFGVLTDMLSQKWMGATRARLGYALGRLLVFGSAGVVYAKRELKGEDAPPFVFGLREAATDVGWTMGGGLEAALTKAVSVRIDYRHSDLGSETRTFRILNLTLRDRISRADQRIAVGLSYAFR